MSSEEKRAFLLLKSIIFQYHGLDEDEKVILIQTAENLGALPELDWANNFINEDPITAFDRARSYFRDVMMTLEKERRLDYLKRVWDANQLKGYISEMEALAMLRLAKDWDIEHDLVNSIKKQ